MQTLAVEKREQHEQQPRRDDGARPDDVHGGEVRVAERADEEADDAPEDAGERNAKSAGGLKHCDGTRKATP